LTDFHARRLAERLGGLPLALATAGAYLHKSNLSFEQYLQEYEKRWNLNPRRPLKLQEYRDRTLYTSWHLSYTRLENDDSDAAKLLKLLAYFDHQNIWYELLHAGVNEDLPGWLLDATADPVDFDSIMRILVEYCFVEVQWTTKSYSMHACVHDWTLAGLNKIVDSHSYWYAFDCVANSVDPGEWEFLGHLQHAWLAPHAARLAHDCFIKVGLLNDFADQRVEKAACLAKLLKEQVQLTAAAVMLQQTLARKEKALGPDHNSTLNTVHSLGLLYSDQGKLDEAGQMYMRALAGYEKALRPDHTSTLDTVNSLGILYCDQGKLDEAEQMYMRALAGYEKALGPDHTSTLRTVHNLGILYRDQGKLDEAEQMYMRALAEKEKALGPDHTSTLNTVHNLGILYCDQGKLDEAEQMYMRALAGKEKALGPDHTSTHRTVYNLGNLYRDQGKLDEAEQMYIQTLAEKEKAFGPDHTSTLSTFYNLGILYRDQGKLDEAEQMYMRALAGYEKALGPDHTSTLDTVHNLSLLYRDQGKLDEAYEMFERAKNKNKANAYSDL
jgi:tetratricopeptide (TPR) repeat protein